MERESIFVNRTVQTVSSIVFQLWITIGFSSVWLPRAPRDLFIWSRPSHGCDCTPANNNNNNLLYISEWSRTGSVHLTEFAQVDRMRVEIAVQIARDTTVGDERKLILKSKWHNRNWSLSGRRTNLFEIFIRYIEHFLDTIAYGRKAFALFYFDKERNAEHSRWIL